jgi:cephalosporin-C deacetylase-like acetyl esterase
VRHVITIPVFIFITFFGISLESFGQNIILKQSHPDGIYKSGQKVKILLIINDKNIDSVEITTLKDFSVKQTQIFAKEMADTLVVFSETFRKPTTYVFEAKTKNEFTSIGLVVDPDKFTPGTACPTDLDKFWDSEKKELRALPIQVKDVLVPNTDAGYQCYDIELNCTGLKPARGYFAKPSSAGPKSLPIVIYLHAAGVHGDWCRSKPEIALRYAKMGRGALAFDLNAHGMLNEQTDEYYRNLEDNELKNYAQIGLENRNDVYFRSMYLRLIRTLDYLTSQQEWDGKRILVIGESQGGGQALAAAGLDHRVSAVIATVPAMCDWGGSLVGRKGCWPYPFETKNDRAKMLSVLPYFDVAHLLKGTRATIVVEIGLIDLTCPSSAVFAALNQTEGKKIIYAVPYRAHHMAQTSYQEIWQNNVYKPIDDFMHDYLK